MTTKHNGPLAGGPKATREEQHTHKNTGGRPENQQNRPQRNRSQPAPAWPRPAGADALDALSRCWALRRRT